MQDTAQFGGGTKHISFTESLYDDDQSLMARKQRRSLTKRGRGTSSSPDIEKKASSFFLEEAPKNKLLNDSSRTGEVAFNSSE